MWSPNQDSNLKPLAYCANILSNELSSCLIRELLHSQARLKSMGRHMDRLVIQTDLKQYADCHSII